MARRSPSKNGAYLRLNKRRVFKAADGICGICSNPVKFGQMTIDHIIPLSRGGHNIYDNVQPAHSLCNHLKGNLLPEEITPKIRNQISVRAKDRYVNRPGRLGKRAGRRARQTAHVVLS
jgi:5-methylcytosine-specific restriction endonuclease McrA